jgi:hypothetical protein
LAAGPKTQNGPGGAAPDQTDDGSRAKDQHEDQRKGNKNAVGGKKGAPAPVFNILHIPILFVFTKMVYYSPNGGLHG